MKRGRGAGSTGGFARLLGAFEVEKAASGGLVPFCALLEALFKFEVCSRSLDLEPFF